MVMIRNIIILIGVLVLISEIFILPRNSSAQEQEKSLAMLQLEIEDMIHNGLKYYLEPRDYVLRVNLVGEQHVSSVKKDVLPGFGPMVDPNQETVDKYWKIIQMEVNLVMHKKVLPSLNNYISEIVPILSGLNYERGDEFNFVPIVPEVLEPTPVVQTEAYPITLIEKVLAVLLVLLILLQLFVLWKLNRIKSAK